MESRSVQEMNGSLYVNIPASMTEALDIKKGDRCELLLLPEYGAILRKEGSEGRFPAPWEAMGELQKEADRVKSELRRFARSTRAQVVSLIWGDILSAMADIKKRGGKQAEKIAEETTFRKGKSTLQLTDQDPDPGAGTTKL